MRGKDVFVIQPTCAPTNDNLMELLVMIDACGAHRAATRGSAIFDMRVQTAGHDRHVFPITAKVVAQMIGDVKAGPRIDR